MRIANLKGGTGKTTSVVYLACALAHSGSTLVFETDSRRASLALGGKRHGPSVLDRCRPVDQCRVAGRDPDPSNSPRPTDA
jgi:cellulose biosynthesis protein BcsQ